MVYPRAGVSPSIEGSEVETRDDAGEPGKCPLSERSQTQKAPRRVLPLMGEVSTGAPAEARG